MQIIPLYFFIALFIGFFIIYITAPPPKIIIKEPTIDNAGHDTYIDDVGICYRYRKEQIKCQ